MCGCKRAVSRSLSESDLELDRKGQQTINRDGCLQHEHPFFFLPLTPKYFQLGHICCLYTLTLRRYLYFYFIQIIIYVLNHPCHIVWFHCCVAFLFCPILCCAGQDIAASSLFVSAGEERDTFLQRKGGLEGGGESQRGPLVEGGAISGRISKCKQSSAHS